jgi:uncharacterized protein (DUF952 family)
VPDAATLIYKLVPAAAWREAEDLGRFTDLLLVAVSTAEVAASLRWEPSRGGALFPHLYGDLTLGAVRAVTPLPLGDDGRHRLPGDLA